MRRLSLSSLALIAVLATGSLCADDLPAIAVRVGAHDDFDRLVFDWPRPVPFHLQRAANIVTVTFDAAAQFKFAADALGRLSRVARGAANLDNGHVVFRFQVDPAAQVRSFTSGAAVVVDVSGKAAPAASTTPVATPAPAAPKAAAAASAAPAAVMPPASAAAKPVASPAAGFALTLNDRPQLVATLDPHLATRAVVFQRADTGYVIFDRKLSLPPAALTNNTALLIDLQTLDLAKNSGYRFALPPDTQLSATRDGTAWKIFAAQKQSDLPVTATLVAQPDFALGARFLLPLPDTPDPIRLTDPVVGDELIVVPLGQSEAFTVERNMADFKILASAQGLVIKAKNDKLIVRTVSDGVEITAEGGLHLSRALDTGAIKATRGQNLDAAKSMFDFATWSGGEGENFIRRRQKLMQTIVDVPAAERNRARLELARFYFASGNGEEALALLNMLAKQVPDLRAHADFIALLGAAQILAGRADEGLAELAAPALSDQPEIELWQAAGLAEQRDWSNAEEKFAVSESLLTGYPEPFFSRFFVLAIESALAVGKDHEAADWLNFVSNAPHRAEIEPALDYVQGALHARGGRAQAAEEAWKTVEKSNDRLYKVRAELALIDLGVSTASLTPAQAADRLEALRFGWRGDDLEIDILRRLGQFYIEAKKPKAGLSALAQAATLYPDSPMTPKIRDEMRAIFREVFVGDLGQKLSALDSLTLYRQYRDLMPAGQEGDDVMRALAERLVAIDLLDQAASLMEDLAKNRLQGQDKDEITLRLAAIRLLDHKPAEAIAALDLIGNDKLQAAAQNDSVLLRARALSELHRDSEAAALLKDNASQGAALLRADIATRAQAWPDAARALMDLVGPPPANGHTVSDAQAEWLIKAAIAYALAEDQVGLDRLAIDYGAAMAGSGKNDAFRILTQPQKTGQPRDLAAAQSQIAQADLFEGFLNTYRAAPAAAKP